MNQPKPAPTAEEQLAELLLPEDPKQWCIVTIDAVIQSVPAIYERGWWYWADSEADPSPAEVVTHWIPAAAALRSNREKDAQYQTLNDVVIAKCTQVKELYAELAEKDAKIAELKQQAKTAMAMCKENSGRLITASAKLRAVSEALKEPERWYSNMHNGFTYTRISVDAIFARLRSIVDGTPD
jgi:hypothetical protein